MSNIFDDAEVQLELLGCCIWDRQWLRAVGDIVTQDDFRPVNKGSGSIAWVVAGIALDFHRKNRIPIASLMGQEIQKWLKESGASLDRKVEVAKFLARVKKHYDGSRSEVLQERVREFKQVRIRQKALRELIELEQANQLTDDKWMEVTQRVIISTGGSTAREYLNELDARDERRIHTAVKRHPSLLIDPLDRICKMIGFGHLGLWLAPYKMGKSTALRWTTSSYLIHGINVLYFTLEDPIEDVEDALDACVTGIIIDDLGKRDSGLERKFRKFKEERAKARLRIVDGTDGGLSVPDMEAIWEREKAAGFDAQAVVIDYDDEIRPTTRRKDRKEEFSDIYRQMRQFFSRKQLIGWTAAQATRDAEGREIITGKFTADDISKMRKVTLAFGVGQGEWGDDSRYINIAAAKKNKMNIGCTIWSDPARGMFYDRDRTMDRIEQERRKYSLNQGAK